jgi:hypothetical protein
MDMALMANIISGISLFISGILIIVTVRTSKNLEKCNYSTNKNFGGLFRKGK